MIALSGAACSNNSRTNENRATGAEGAPAAARDSGTAAKNDQSPVTMTGCLQHGDGRSFILTEINSPRTSVGTSGSTAAGDPVGREQMREAAHAYRLKAEDDKSLEGLVGHQVRVSGTVTERADLPATAANDKPATDRAAGDRKADDRAAATSGSNPDRQKIDEGDLASIQVASIDSVADACGSSARTGGKTTRSGASSRKK